MVLLTINNRISGNFIIFIYQPRSGLHDKFATTPLVVGGTVVEIDARLAPVLASTNPILEELRNEISVSDGQVGVNPKRNPKRTLE